MKCSTVLRCYVQISSTKQPKCAYFLICFSFSFMIPQILISLYNYVLPYTNSRVLTQSSAAFLAANTDSENFGVFCLLDSGAG